MFSDNKFFNFSAILICLFPVLLISGPFLSDLSATYLGFSFLLYCIFTKQLNFFKNYYFFYFLFIYFYLNINSLLGFDYEISFKSSIPFLRIILFIFSICFFIQKFPKIKFIYLKVFFVGIVCLFLYSLYEISFKQDFFGNPIHNTARITSLFGTEEIMGSYTSRLLPLALGLLFFFDSKFRYIASYIIIFLSVFLVLMSGERTSLVYILLFLIFYLFIIHKKQILNIFFILFFVITAAFFINPKSMNRIFIHTFDQIKLTQTLGFSLRHTLHYLTAYEMFLNRPIVGHGLKSFRHLCDKDEYNNYANLSLFQTTEAKKNLKGYNNGCNTHPHNIYLEFLSELGATGFVLFGSIFLYSVYQITILLYLKFLKKQIFSDKQRCLFLILAGIFITMFPILPSGSYFNNWMLVISYLPIGFYLGIKNSK